MVYRRRDRYTAGLLKLSLLFCTLLSLFIAAVSREKTSTGVEESTAQFRTDSGIFAARVSALQKALQLLDSSRPETIVQAKQALTNSRLAYKKIAYLLEYFFYTSSRVYNRAPKNEIEEPFLEYQEPAGLQYIEAMLFDSFPEKHQVRFAEQSRLLRVASGDLNALLYQFRATDQELLESIRLELVRVISLSITGFDAPLLKSGIAESAVSIETIQKVLSPYFRNHLPGSDSVAFYLKKTIAYLHKNPDFDSFNRLDFLTECGLPLQKNIGKMIRENHLETNKYGVLNYDADHIFSRNAFSKKAFPASDRIASRRETELGKKLFSDTGLSGNGTKSCASCHNPANYFADGLPRSIGFDRNTTTKRNAPSLLYANFQHSQFWDGRVKSLEEQVEAVIKDPLEMHGKTPEILSKINADKAYKRAFQKAFAKGRQEPVTDQEVYKAIAAYIRTLNPYNSSFDRYLQGDGKTLTDAQKSGFNLFMGKAQCGTCHFAPLFNGLIPPFYALTEFEILGTTTSDNLAKPAYDLDEGRFVHRPIPFYKGAFKTPTVRNTARTGPYMHNGAFRSLETLLEFYNQGGGAGLGLTFPSQTLPAAKLNLTEREKKDIIAFLNALTDDLKNI